MELAETTTVERVDIVHRIITGSCDGTTKVWTVNNGGEKSTIDLNFSSEKEIVGVTSIATTQVYFTVKIH